MISSAATSVTVPPANVLTMPANLLLHTLIDSCPLTRHAKRMTMMPDDIKLVRVIRRESAVNAKKTQTKRPMHGDPERDEAQPGFYNMIAKTNYRPPDTCGTGATKYASVVKAADVAMTSTTRNECLRWKTVRVSLSAKSTVWNWNRSQHL